MSNLVEIIAGKWRAEFPADDLDEDDLEQLEVMVEAFLLYLEKNGKYANLWKEGGHMDSAHHVRHKGARVGMLATQPLAAPPNKPQEFIEDALDLINYSCFFVRNVRDGR
jgi:hypothetical protein